VEDLNDKITGNTLTADEWNQIPSEIQNVIQAFIPALSGGDLDQLGKSVAAYAAAGNFYTGGGAADVYTATKLSGIQAPPDYFTGMLVRFRAPAANTGAATVNVAALGIKNIKREDGSALNADDIVTTRDAWMSYDGTDFLLTNWSSDDITPVAAADPSELIGILERIDNTSVMFRPSIGDNLVVNVDGVRLTRNTDLIFILGDFGVGGSHLDTGLEDSSTPYYLYINNDAGVMEPVISATAPHDIGDAKPGYHPTRTDERCIGSIWNNASETIVPFFMNGNEVLFTLHDNDHEHSLVNFASTTWLTVTLEIPLTATSVKINFTGRSTSGVGMVCYGASNASGTLTSDSSDPRHNNSILLATICGTTTTNQGVGVSGVIPIADRTTPAFKYANTRNLTDEHVGLVIGYTDMWAPK
jgi:hypothetical protein